MVYRNSSLKEYLDDLAAKLPAPGGGSAAALNAALGAALVSMAVNFTLGKPKYAKFEKELKNILREAEKLRVKFLNLVDLDVAAYKSGNLKKALGVPLLTARLCSEAIKLCPPLIKKGNINLISDVAVAAILIEGAFAAAYFNVEINLKFLKDKALGRKIRAELEGKRKKVIQLRRETEGKVGSIIRG